MIIRCRGAVTALLRICHEAVNDPGQIRCDALRCAKVLADAISRKLDFIEPITARQIIDQARPAIDLFES
jgi:hypothetical protein